MHQPLPFVLARTRAFWCCLLAVACQPEDVDLGGSVDPSTSTVTVSRSAGLVADGIDAANITVTLKTASGVRVPGQQVHFDATGAANLVAPERAASDARGVAESRLASLEPATKRVVVTVNPETAPVVLLMQPEVTFGGLGGGGGGSSGGGSSGGGSSGGGSSGGGSSGGGSSGGGSSGGGSSGGGSSGGGSSGGSADAGACPAPMPGEWHVASTGADVETSTAGNGSAACPFKTLTRAIAKVAAQMPATPATITLHRGTYGAGCTAGPPCDALPISVPFEVTQPLTLQGDGAPADVTLTGGTPVLNIVAFTQINVQHLTVVPTFNGITYDLAAMGTVSDVVVQGSSTAGAMIIAAGSSRPTIGPGVQLLGGTNGMRLIQGARAAITGSPTAQTVVRGSTGACLWVHMTTLDGVLTVDSSAGNSNVIISDCGGQAVLVNTGFRSSGIGIEHTLITRGDGGTFDGVVVTGSAGSSVGTSAITGLLGDAIVIRDNSRVIVYGSAITGNSGDAVDCGDTGTVLFGSGEYQGNAGNGAFIHGACSADFTSVSTLGHTFNSTSRKNGLSGVCYQSSAMSNLMLGGVAFSCDYTGASCVTASAPLVPTVATSTTCAADRNLTLAPGITWSGSPVSCCN